MDPSIKFGFHLFSVTTEPRGKRTFVYLPTKLLSLSRQGYQQFNQSTETGWDQGEPTRNRLKGLSYWGHLAGEKRIAYSSLLQGANTFPSIHSFSVGLITCTFPAVALLPPAATRAFFPPWASQLVVMDTMTAAWTQQQNWDLLHSLMCSNF